jgi:DNA-binding NarL/FixJ family response regulator
MNTMTRRPAPVTPRINLVVVDDHNVVRKGVAACLSQHEDLDLVAEGDTIEHARTLLHRHRPHVALLNPRLAGSASFMATADLCREFPRVRVLLFATMDCEAIIYYALQAGAAGCVLKTADGIEIVKAIRQVASGERYFSFDAAQRLAARAMQSELTEREVEILRQVANGKSNKEIGGLLHLAEDTVKRHLTHLFGKLHVVDRAHAVAVAMRRGLIDNA